MEVVPIIAAVDIIVTMGTTHSLRTINMKMQAYLLAFVRLFHSECYEYKV